MQNMVFIIGTGRCGSTFVHEILAKHESMGFISNIEDNLSLINKNGRWNNALYRSFLGNHTLKGALRFAPSEGYKIISQEVSPIYANSNRDLIASDVSPWLKSRFQNFFESRDSIQNKPVFSHKYTGWPRMSFFKEIFPDAKFIHIVRDGRAVANSWLQMPWWGGYRGPENWLWGELPEEYRMEWNSRGNTYPHLAAISWKVLMEAFENAEHAFDSSSYLKIRYEDILEHPREKFEEMLAFSGLEWTDKFEKSFSKQVIKKGRSRAFEEDLNGKQLDDIEYSLSEILSRYNYN
jgi:hypothetical protein